MIKGIWLEHFMALVRLALTESSAPRRLMNKIKPQQGGPLRNSKKAIHDLQFKQFGFKGAAGVIELRRQTIERINQLTHQSTIVFQPTGRSERSRGDQSEMAPAGGSDFGRSSANDRLDRHFALGKLSPTARYHAIRKIQEAAAGMERQGTNAPTRMVLLLPQVYVLSRSSAGLHVRRLVSVPRSHR